MGDSLTKIRTASSPDDTISKDTRALCLGCGRDRLSRVRRYRTKTRHGNDIFHASWLCICDDCGLVQAMPRPDIQQLMNYYAVDYREGCCAGADVADPTRFPKDNLFYYNRGQSAAELIASFCKAGDPKVLDIGAGYGHILHAIGERYPNARRFATEFSEQSIEHLRSLGFEVFPGDIENGLAKIEDELDVVILSHVFEHLLDLKSVLERVYSRLAPGGLMYIDVPNIPSWSLLRYLDHVWAPRFDEPHISFFSTSVLRNLLESVGFEVEFCDTVGPQYKPVSKLRYALPTMRWLIQGLMPSILFNFLRQQKFTNRLQIPERVEAFYEHGGTRIWIRTLSRKPLT